MSDVVTPLQVERRLLELGRELDDSYKSCSDAERLYMDAKSRWEIASARARMSIKDRAAKGGYKVTVAEVEDEALLRCQDELLALNGAEAVVKAMRANMVRVRTQIDIARSLGTSVRAAFEG